MQKQDYISVVFFIVILIALVIKLNAAKQKRNVKLTARNGRGFDRSIFNKEVRQTEQYFSWKQLSMIKFSFRDATHINHLEGFTSLAELNDTPKNLPRKHSLQQKFLPHVKPPLQVISAGETCYSNGKIKAIPDAVFYDAERNTYLVVEYKSWEFKNMWSLMPESVFQVLISTEVLKQALQRSSANETFAMPQFETYVRLNDQCIQVTGWEQMRDHVMSIAYDLSWIKPSKTIGAKQAATLFVLFDPVFKRKSKVEAERILLGQLRHLRMSQNSPQKAA